MSLERGLAYIGLGANLNQPLERLRQACSAIGKLPESERLAVSAVYRTAPIGPADQPDYLNAVLSLNSGLQPRDLLVRLQAIETSQGRVRDSRRWQARSLDLDLLLYDQQVLDLPELQLPHPRMHERGFVLVPLADVAPADLYIPGRGRLDRLLAACDRSGVWAMPQLSLQDD